MTLRFAFTKYWLLWLTVAVLLGCGFTWMATRPSRVTYNGRSADDWLRQSASSGFARKESIEALRMMGDDGIRHLVRLAFSSLQPSFFAAHYVHWTQKLPGRARDALWSLWRPEDPEHAAALASEALRDLRPDADHYVPLLSPTLAEPTIGGIARPFSFWAPLGPGLKPRLSLIWFTRYEPAMRRRFGSRFNRFCFLAPQRRPLCPS